MSSLGAIYLLHPILARKNYFVTFYNTLKTFRRRKETIDNGGWWMVVMI
jgi:hypothetical protein